MAKRVTVIDIGSNSVRMVVYEKTSRFSFHILHEEKSRVRISENSYQNGGDLQEIPMQRAFNVLDDFLLISQSYKSRKILCVATSALRDAPNKKEFIHKVRDRLKLNIKIIDGKKEAYFGAIACANLLPKQENSVTIDIGGGSTELAIINDKDISHSLSLNLGTVRIKELFLDNNNFSEAKEYIDEELEKLVEFFPSTIVGLGGTFRAISLAIMQKSDYPFDKIHAYEYSKEKLQNFLSQILNSSTDKMLQELGIPSNRLDDIRSGTLILERILVKLSSVTDIITSKVGVREGVYLADMLRNSKHRFPHNYNSSVRYLIDTQIVDTNYSNQLNTLVKKLFDLTSDYFSLDKKYRYELGLSAKLYSRDRYNSYRIETALEYGFKHSEIILIATLQKYVLDGSLSQKYKKRYALLLPENNSLDSLSYLLALAVALLTHKPRNIDFKLEFIEGILYVESKRELYLSKEAVKKLSSYKDFRINF